MKEFYVGYPHKTPNFETIFDAVNAVSEDNQEPCNIYIAQGTYRECLEIKKPFITLLGECAEKTVIVYGNYANEILKDGSKRGTFRSYSVFIDTHDFTAKNITFQNDSGLGYQVGQALALYVDADRCAFENCRLLSGQDTLFTAPLPEKEMQVGGFIGPKQFAPRINGRQYYKNCYIEGDIDFIFGSATAYFESCEFFSLFPKGKPINPEETSPVYGYVTAASTPKQQKYGYILDRCKFTSDCPPQTVYLGRPWRAFAHTVLLNCELGAHIKPEGWHDWDKPHSDIRYEEYNSTGAGATPEKRAVFSKQLTKEEAAKYTKELVLGDWAAHI